MNFPSGVRAFFACDFKLFLSAHLLTQSARRRRLTDLLLGYANSDEFWQAGEDVFPRLHKEITQREQRRAR
jgi:hypothetical protein